MHCRHAKSDQMKVIIFLFLKIFNFYDFTKNMKLYNFW